MDKNSKIEAQGVKKALDTLYVTSDYLSSSDFVETVVEWLSEKGVSPESAMNLDESFGGYQRMSLQELSPKARQLLDGIVAGKRIDGVFKKAQENILSAHSSLQKKAEEIVSALNENSDNIISHSSSKNHVVYTEVQAVAHDGEEEVTLYVELDVNTLSFIEQIPDEKVRKEALENYVHQQIRKGKASMIEGKTITLEIPHLKESVSHIAHIVSSVFQGAKKGYHKAMDKDIVDDHQGTWL